MTDESAASHFELNFTDERMARDYVKLYQQMIHPKSASMTVEEGAVELDGSGIAHPQYYIATTSSPADDRARVLKYGRMFFVFDRLGDVQTSGLGEEGLFYDGMRHLSCIVVESVERTATVVEFHGRDQ